MNEAVEDAGRFERFADEFYLRSVILGYDFKMSDIQNIEVNMSKFIHDGDEPIVIRINSNGGTVAAANRLRHLITEYGKQVPVYGLVTGLAMSAAPYVLIACQVRMALPEATFALHINTIGIRMTPFTNRLKAAVEAWKLGGILRRSHREIVEGFRSGLPKLTEESIIALMIESRNIGAEEALELGIIDMIVRV